MTWIRASTRTRFQSASLPKHGWKSTAFGENVGAAGLGGHLSTNTAAIALRGTPRCGAIISAGTGAPSGAKYWNGIPIRAGSAVRIAAGAETGTMSFWTSTISYPSRSEETSGPKATSKHCAAPATSPRPCWTTGCFCRGAGLTGAVLLRSGFDRSFLVHIATRQSLCTRSFY